ncbi:MAG: DMT family transporter [Flavobacteriales bacterium]
MSKQSEKWLYLLVLGCIWGSSFILIKKGLLTLNPLQLGSLRILFSTCFLLLIGFRSISKIQKKDWIWIALSALLGTFIPVFLFAYAETEIDSSVAAILNSLVPLMTIALGALIFRIKNRIGQILGVLIGFIGTLILILKGADINADQDYRYSLLVVLASICYALNINVIKSKLQNIPALAIAVGNFVLMLIPSLFVLWFSDFFAQETLAQPELKTSIIYVLILAIFGTGIAKIMFNKLVQLSSPVFASSVTYVIPIVAIGFGFADGERFHWIQLLGGGFIFLGIFLANKKTAK